jgi:hypothetical protein
VVASWVGAGLDLGAAVHATRLLKTGMTVEEVIRTTSKAHNIPEELLRGAYTASGKGTSDPVLLKNVLTSALPKEIAQQAGKNVDVAVLSAEEFAKQTGSKTGNAVTKLVKGEDGVLRAQVLVREGADPNVLLEEAAHVAQLSDPKLTPKLAKLTEENLANWPKMKPQQQVDLYKAKLELEIDAQKRVLQQFSKSDPSYIAKVQQNLENLELRLAEVDVNIKNPESIVSKYWWDKDQAPRLFNKDEVPSVRNSEFAKWFNSLKADEFNQIWANPKLRQSIESRLRSPGGLHEWHLVSRANVFKEWGVTAEQIADMRTIIKDVKFINPIGRHGGKGSTAAHNEILDIIDTSSNYEVFKRRLQNWASYRLDGGTDALPIGLKPEP